MNFQLHNAIKNNDSAGLDRLIAAGCDVNGLCNNGFTALQRAVIEGNIQIIQKLLAAGADIDLGDNNWNSALHVASALGKIDVVEKLLAAGANVDLQDNNGHSALHMATIQGKLDVIQKLLAAGANVDLQDNNGQPALYAAISNNGQKLIYYLLDAGADPALTGTSILSHAVIHGYDTEIIKLILDKGYSNAGIFDLCEEDFYNQISEMSDSDIVNQLEVYTKIKLVKFIHSKGKICKNSNYNKTFFDLITDTDIKDQDLPYHFDQEKVDEIYTELNKNINIPIASNIITIMSRMACRAEIIDRIYTQYNEYKQDVSSKKTKFRIFELNSECLYYLLNKLNTSDLLCLLAPEPKAKNDVTNINEQAYLYQLYLYIVGAQNEGQVDLNNSNIQVECESYTNETQQEESENNTYVHAMGEN
ncbi:ankyrin repeat domain-containing protein [Orientia tsutsugamushi]|uniref:Ankyrin repeat-containing protein 14 n=2 Tax=Orientia tsutsugamushi TaxID=784 RepID=B3CSY0_ORITI|nr:ankyrin repeat domain-containing protein [Orientia tsutsugamushi]KJV54401.1 ankyrin repeat family protein [Orientia tsutsugamushi str. Kato PP]BAG40477.1 ankyrin repeat-containing protein 14 [Orientia tsutsugamushi str. Ikeda]SPR05848.1 ankyrin repeat-containing protein 14 [Orientia tsutsugamushi]